MQRLRKNLLVPDFRGKTYNPARDHDRLNSQLWRVFNVMKNGEWWTLYQIQQEILKRHGRLDPDGSISRRIRDLKEERCGLHDIRSENVSGGVWRYRLVIPDPRQALLFDGLTAKTADV